MMRRQMYASVVSLAVASAVVAQPPDRPKHSGVPKVENKVLGLALELGESIAQLKATVEATNWQQNALQGTIRLDEQLVKGRVSLVKDIQSAVRAGQAERQKLLKQEHDRSVEVSRDLQRPSEAIRSVLQLLTKRQEELIERQAKLAKCFHDELIKSGLK